MFGAKRLMPKPSPRDGDGPGGFAGGGVIEAFRKFFLDDFMRIPNTDYDLFDAVGQGIPMMVGFPAGTRVDAMGQTLASGQGLIEFALNLVSTPAYYASYLRRIVMSGQTIAGQISGLVTAFSGGAAVSGVEKIFPTLKAIFDSPVFRFFAISAGVGDGALKYFFGDRPDNENILAQNKGLAVVNNPDRAAAGITAETKTDGQHIGGTSKEIADAIKIMGSTALLRGNLTRFNNASYKNPLSLSSFPASQITDNRLKHPRSGEKMPELRRLSVDKFTARTLEMALDAEYIPFYFHDLRTGEIVSLPAFVTSFDDSFAVTYNEVQSYGRQDAVKIYGNTTRSVNLAFKIVAYNEADHFAMYYTINKLITMLYPQYSKGITRQLEVDLNDGNKEVSTFIQPFSQVPAASPVIRIRLGDIFKSNYTDTALKKLFGYDPDNGAESIITTGLTAAGQPSAIKAKATEATIDALKKTVAKIPAKFEGETAEEQKNAFLDLLKDEKLRTRETGKVRLTLGGRGNYKALKDGLGKKTKDKKVRNANKAAYSIHRKNVLINKHHYGVIRQGEGSEGQIDIFKVGQEGTEPVATVEDTLEAQLPKCVDHNDFKVPNVPVAGKFPGSKVLNDEIEKAVTKAQDDAGATKAKRDKAVDHNKFFEPANNAIVRSFHSTRGKGLAGVITNMALDYSEAPWGTEYEGRAPLIATITMGFSPIHDLPLGLDADGRMRAPAIPANNPFVDRGDAELVAGDATSTASVTIDHRARTEIGTEATRIRGELLSARLGGKSDEDFAAESDPPQSPI